MRPRFGAERANPSAPNIELHTGAGLIGGNKQLKKKQRDNPNHSSGARSLLPSSRPCPQPCNCFENGSFLCFVSADSGFWSIPVEKLRPLIIVLESDIKVWISKKTPKYEGTNKPVEFDGKSYAFAEYFKQMKIDPKRDARYSQYYSNQRHSIAGSYVWAGSGLSEFADQLEKPIHSGKLCWIDVLINCQYEIESSGQVVGLTGEVYNNCDVLILLSASIFTRAW